MTQGQRWFWALFLGVGLAAGGWAQGFGSLPGAPSVKVDFAWKDGAVEATMIVPPGFYQDKNTELFYLEALAPARSGPTEYPAPVNRKGKQSYVGTVTLRMVPAWNGEPPTTLDVALHYQICNVEGVCFLPKVVQGTVAVTAGAEATLWMGREAGGKAGKGQAEDFTPPPRQQVAKPKAPEAVKTVPTNTPAANFPSPVTPPAQISPPVSAPASGAGTTDLAQVLFYLLLAFTGGFLLNLMPCVFPLLSIQALSVVKSLDLDRRAHRRQGLGYGAGILVSLLAVAGLVIGLKASGEAAGWGFYFQNPGFVAVMVTVLFAFSLSLFGVFELSFSGSSLSSARRGSAGGSFAAGIFAVVAAAPCTAPFLGSALGFAFAQPYWLIPVFFAIIGLGFALPYVLLGFFPVLVRVLPKAGPWMQPFQVVLGFVLAGTALYLFNTLAHQVEAGVLVRLLVFLLILAAALWLFGLWAGPVAPVWRRWVLGAAVVALAGAGLSWYVQPATASGSALSASESSAASQGWQTFSRAKLAELRAGGQKVFVDVYAEWCTNCKVNEAAVFSDPALLAAMDQAGWVRLRADFTNPDPDIAAWLTEVGRAGLPVYAAYFPGQPTAIFLPELLTKDLLKEGLGLKP